MPTHTTMQLFKVAAPLVVVMGAAAIGGLHYRRLSAPLRYLAWLAWFELPLELLGNALGLYHQNNLFIMPLYTVGELVLLALVYQATLRSAAFQRVMPWLVGAFFLYTVADCLLAPDLTWFKPGQQVTQSLLILGMVAMYFRQTLQNPEVARLEREPMFWVSVGLALYFLGYLQIALFSNYMLTHYSMQFNRDVWTVHTVLFFFLHGCYCWALRLDQAVTTAPAVAEPARREAVK